MKRLLTILMGASLLAAMTLTAMAQPGPREGAPGRQLRKHFALGRVLQNKEARAKLGITDEQFEKLQAAFLNSEKTAIKTRADLQIQRLELHALMSADKVDRAQVNQKINEISALQTALMKNQIDARLTVKETLTPDQIQKLQQIQQELTRNAMRQRMQMRMGMMDRQRQPGMGPRRPQGPGGPPAPQPPPPPARPGDDTGR